MGERTVSSVSRVGPEGSGAVWVEPVSTRGDWGRKLRRCRHRGFTVALAGREGRRRDPIREEGGRQAIVRVGDSSGQVTLVQFLVKEDFDMRALATKQHI